MKCSLVGRTFMRHAPASENAFPFQDKTFCFGSLNLKYMIQKKEGGEREKKRGYTP